VHEEGAPNADNANAAEQRKAAKPIKLKMDPAQRLAQRELATQAVLAVLTSVELEVTEGHGKASASAAASLRQVLKEHGRNLDTALDQRVHEALTAAGELEGWQRWRADQMRMTLVEQAEALFKTVSVKSANKPAKLKLPKLDSSTPQPEHQAEESVDAVAKEASTQPEAQDIAALSEHAQEPGQEAPVQEFVQAEPVQEEAEQAEPVQELVLQAPDVTPAAETETEKSTPIAVAAEKFPPWEGARCKTPCVNCASSGSKRTKAVCPITLCGNVLTQPATKHTKWFKLGWTKSNLKPVSTALTAWLCLKKSRPGARPMPTIQTGAHTCALCISLPTAGAWLGI
jgi:hypothetical protein